MVILTFLCFKIQKEYYFYFWWIIRLC